MKRYSLKDISAILAVYLFWGSGYAFIKIYITYISPFFATFLRCLIVVLVLTVFVLVKLSREDSENMPSKSFRRKLQNKLPSRKAAHRSFLKGVLFLAVAVGLLSFGMQSMSASLAVLIFATVPAWLALLAAVKGDLNWKQLLVGICGVIGVGLIFLEQLTSAKTSLSALLIVLAAALIWSGSSFFLRDVEKVEEFSIGIWIQAAVGGTILLLISWFSGELSQFQLTSVPIQAWGALVGVALFASLLAYSAFQHLLVAHPPQVANSSTFINPLVAVLSAMIILGERLSSFSLLVGGGVVLVSAYLTLTDSRVLPIKETNQQKLTEEAKTEPLTANPEGGKKVDALDGSSLVRGFK